MNQIVVEHHDDPRILTFTGLSDEALRRRREGSGGDLFGLFVCEGTQVTRRAMAAGFSVHSVLVDEAMVRRLPTLPEDTPVYVGSADVIERIVGFRFHRGFVAAFRRPPAADPGEILDGAKRVLICENVTDATNLGVMIRSAVALGFDALLVDPTSCDPLYRRTTRVSMGGAFLLPYARIGRLPESLAVLRRRDFRLVGLTPRTESSSPIGSVDPSPKIALVLGAEGPGLSPSTETALDELAHIPMTPGVDSLNVGAAAAIAAYAIGGLDASRPGTPDGQSTLRR